MVDLVAVAVLGPKGLALAPGIVFDNAVGRVEDVGGGTVVLFQADRFGPGEYLLEIEDILNGRAAEFVNGLVVVAHHADVVGAAASRRTRWNWAMLVSWYSSTTT